MSPEVQTYADWLEQAAVVEAHLTATQQQLLHAAFGFLQECSADYYSRRLLSHFLLHCRAGLKTAAIARLVGFSRSTAVDHQGCSSKEVVQAAHQRLVGRAHGKLLPRYAGPLAQFLHQHPAATRWDLLDFVQRTWGVSVSRMALYRFLKKYGLDQTGRVAAVPLAGAATPVPPPPTATPPGVSIDRGTADPVVVPAVVPSAAAATATVPLPAPEFFLPRPSMPAPSSSCPAPSTGWPSPPTASRTATARCSAGS
jgi:transposase